MVPVETTGEAAGVKTGGGVLEHVLFKIKARALPKDLTGDDHRDVSHLIIGRDSPRRNPGATGSRTFGR